jgi:hypothetical protein
MLKLCFDLGKLLCKTIIKAVVNFYIDIDIIYVIVFVVGLACRVGAGSSEYTLGPNYDPWEVNFTSIISKSSTKCLLQYLQPRLLQYRGPSTHRSRMFK